jgi:hypothetical protein
MTVGNGNSRFRWTSVSTARLVYGTAPGIVTLSVEPRQRPRALGALNAAIGLGFAAGRLVGKISAVSDDA